MIDNAPISCAPAEHSPPQQHCPIHSTTTWAFCPSPLQHTPQPIFHSCRYTPTGFIVNGIQVESPILCLPDTWLMWDVSGFNDINSASLAILDLMEPAPEVLVVGCGRSMIRLPQALQQELESKGISVELLDSVSDVHIPGSMICQCKCTVTTGCHACGGIPCINL